MKKRLFTASALAMFLGAASQASAAQATPGHITGYTVSSSYNYPFRVTMDTSTTGCAFFYADMSNSNYQAYVSGLLTALSMHKTVQISYDVDQNGYCVILEYNAY